MSEFREANPYLNVESALTAFADKLLERGVAYSEVWRRAVFLVPPESQEPLMASLTQLPLGELLIRPGTPIPYYEAPGERPIIASERPAGISIVIEDFDRRTHGGWRDTSVDLCLTYMNKMKSDYAQVRIRHTFGQQSFDRFIVMPRYTETAGYGGHGFEMKPVTPEELQAFFELLATCLAPRLSEESSSDLYRRMVYVDVDTGERFCYDEAAKTHVSPRGVSMDEYKSLFSRLDERRRFRMEYLNDTPEI